VTACLSIPIAMILVRMGIGILSLYLSEGHFSNKATSLGQVDCTS
jgi:peptidoglycan biosynthesis protein MviN/MurJ (putative lipid II flippase)